MVMQNSHGDYKLIQIQDIVVIRTMGAWNQECVRNYIESSEAHFAKVKSLQVVIIIDVSLLEGMTPDALMLMNSYNLQCKARNMFRSQVYYAPSSNILLKMALTLLKVTDTKQISIKSPKALRSYLSKEFSESVISEVMAVLESSDLNE